MGLRQWIGSAAVAALVLVAGTAVTTGAARPASAAPPIWEVTDSDSRMVLFGTVHVLRPETQWMTRRLEEALRTADRVWFEVDPERMSDPRAMEPLMPLMMDQARPLSSRLSPADRERLARVAADVGVIPAQLEPFKPVAASMMLAATAMIRAGYSPDSGVDMALRRIVPAGRVGELETMEQQIRFITELPDPVQVALLLATLDDIADLGHLDKVVEGWAAGDLEVMERLFLRELMEDYPEAYEAFLRRRNIDWAEQLEQRLRGAGQDVVAVGALHMLGPDGLPELLAARGFTVRRVQ